MGLFGMFEKKKLSGYEKNLDTIYRFAIEKGLIKYYPDGKEQIDIVITSIADIVGVDIQKLEPE